MTITINVRLSSGSYHARAKGLGVAASSAQGAKAAAQAVCRKLGVDSNLLEQSHTDIGMTAFAHPGTAASS